MIIFSQQTGRGSRYRGEVRETEIRSLEVDFDKGILKINGKEFAESPIIVTLPGPEDRFPYQKLFNPELATGHKEECDKITVTYERGEHQ